MSKVSSVQKNRNRRVKVDKFAAKRRSLKEVVYNRSSSLEERFAAQIALSSLPRNSSRVRLRNRCQLTGRPRGFYRKFQLSRIALRELASEGLIPGLTKASW